MRKKLFHYVYISKNLINGKQYVGDRSCNCSPEEDIYLGSGRPAFQNALKKHGRENFEKKILEFFDSKEEAFDAQEKYIKLYKTHISQWGYNISRKGGLGVKSCFNHSKESKEKISIKGRGISRNKGIVRNNKTREKISKTLKEKYKNGEIENAFKGKSHTNKSREKLSKSHIGKKHSDETKGKISKNNARNKPWLGKKMSEETRQKMSEARKGKKRGKYKKSLIKTST